MQPFVNLVELLGDETSMEEACHEEGGVWFPSLTPFPVPVGFLTLAVI